MNRICGTITGALKSVWDFMSRFVENREDCGLVVVIPGPTGNKLVEIYVMEVVRVLMIVFKKVFKARDGEQQRALIHTAV